MKILIVLPRIPFPLDSGGNQAVFSMLEALSERHEVDVAAMQGNMHHRREAQKSLPSVKFLDLPDALHEDGNYPDYGIRNLWFRLICYFAASFRRKYFRWLPRTLNVFSPIYPKANSTLLRSHGNSDENSWFFSCIASLVQKSHYDLVQAEFSPLLPLARWLPHNVNSLFVHHELAWVRMENELSLFQDAKESDRIHLEEEKEWELASLSRYKHLIVLTENDKLLLSGQLQKTNIHVSPAVLHSHDRLPFTPCGHDLVYSGSAAHYPNQDAIIWFCKEVAPKLRENGFTFRLHITGKWPGRVKKELLKKFPELAFTGYVENLPRLLNGKIAIMPIRIGSGMRMKTLEAIQASAPIISTKKGIEGLDFVPGEDYLEVSDAARFAQSVIALSKDCALQKKLAENAHARQLALYDPKEAIARRLALYDEIAKDSC